MPVSVTYPGVYVQPIITQAPTAQGVATSITAFIGRAFMGPVNTATTILCFADFERQFGGLSADFPLSYAINDFYNNGGGEAVIVRLYAPIFSSSAVQAMAQAVVADLTKAVAGKTTGADVLAALDKEILKPATPFNDYQQSIAQQIQTQFHTLVTPTMSGDALTAAENQAYGFAVRQTSSSLSINIVNTLNAAVQGVYQAAVVAAAGSPDDAATVTMAVSRAISSYGPTPAVAATVLSTIKSKMSAASSKAPPSGAGSWTALQVAQMAPAAIEAALNLPTLYKTIDADFTAALGVAQAGYTAATGANPTPQSVFKAIGDKGKAAGAPGAAVVQAAEDVLANGGQPYDIAAAALLATIGVVSAEWPNTLSLVAANDGSWGNDLIAMVDTNGQSQGSGLFNLTINYVTPTGSTMSEQFRGVSVDTSQPNAKRLDVVLATSSMYVRVPTSNGAPILPPTPPDAQSTGSGTNGSDSNPLALGDYLGDPLLKTGLYALEQVPIFNILCIPPDQRGDDTPTYVYQVAAEYCSEKLAMLILDPPGAWYQAYQQGQIANIQLSSLGSFSSEAARSSAIYFPRMIAVDPLQNGQQAVFPACGAIAGIWAATDVSRGVWKAPAGLGAAFNGIVGLQANLTDAETGLLNPQGINCLRTFRTGGSVIWGARTLRGADALEDEYKYVPVQRMLLYISNSLLVNTQWAVFEPNDEPLWAELRLSVGVFMAGLFRKGAFQGNTADQAYFVKCDSTTTTQDDIDAGIVNVQVGFAPLKPAEFVVITIQQIRDQAS